MCLKHRTYFCNNKPLILISRSKHYPMLDQPNYNEKIYSKDNKKGPTIICISCGRSFLDRSMFMLTNENILNKVTLEFLKETCLLLDGTIK